jgi:serine/threonine protein kinase
MKDIQHPSIMSLKFSLQNKDKLFLGMKFCPGGDISNYIKRRGRLS